MARVPGPSYPSIVQTAYYLARPEGFLRDCHRRYGDVFTVRTVIFGAEVCVVRPEMIKQIFLGDTEQFRAGVANIPLEPMVGRRSVLLLDGAEHVRQRRLMMPPFHGERMAAYARTIREITERISDDWPRERPFALHPHMQRLTLEVILRTIFGVERGERLEALRDAIAALLDRTSTVTSMVGTIPPLRRDFGGISPWAAFKRCRKRVDDLIYSEIAARRASGLERRDDVLSMLIGARDENGEAMTDEELRDELMTLLVAGHETTATALCWAFDAVLRDPRVLARIVDEAKEGDLQRLPYLEATVKEVLRLSPVIPAVGRAIKEPMTFAGYDIEAGTLLVPGIWLTHRLPDIYPEPETFRPERFLDKKIDPYAWLPFGGGPRRCLGIAFALFEMKTVLATVLARVRARVVNPEPAKVALRGFTHAPQGGVPIVVERRPASAPVSRERRESVTPAAAS
jgi:cytochrome P450